LALTGYVRINNQGKPENVYHTQIDCGRSDNPVVTMTLQEEDGQRSVTYRGRRAVVRVCSKCKPELVWKWQDQAKCLSVWPAVDMLEVGKGQHLVAKRLIKEYCDPCKVSSDCAAFALARREEIQGIWGGVFVPPGSGGHNDAILALQVKHGMLDASDAA
jgi:hypothetical protein